VFRYIRWQVLLIILGVALVGILLAYLAMNYTTVRRPGRGGTYVEGIAGAPHYLNPLLSSSQVDRDICSLIFRGLTRLNEHGEVEPDLATRWEVTLDGLTYTFYLRPDIYWHDGTPFTAADVLFTIDLLQSSDFPGPSDLGSEIWKAVTVEKLDRYRVRFTLSEPYSYAPFLSYTTMGLLPAHLLKGVPVANLSDMKFNLSPVGTGPFQMEEVKVEDGIVTTMVLKQNTRDSKRLHLDRVQFRFYPSYKEVLDAYEVGEVEGIAKIPPSSLERARSFSKLNLFSAQIAELGMVLFNFSNPDLPFFQEQEVRQALLYTLDRRRIIDAALDGQALVAHTPLIPGTWAYNDDVMRYDLDLEAAGALLDEAGWVRSAEENGVRHKDGKSLKFTLLTSSDPERVRVAQMLSQQWAAIGITTTVETALPLDVQDALDKRDFEAAIVHLALPGDPDPYPFWHQTQIEEGQNYSGLDHRRISEIIEWARVKTSQERRRDLYHEFQNVFAQEVPALLLYVPVYTCGVDDHIHDVQISPLMYSSDRFRTISDWWVVPHYVFVKETKPSNP